MRWVPDGTGFWIACLAFSLSEPIFARKISAAGQGETIKVTINATRTPTITPVGHQNIRRRYQGFLAPRSRSTRIPFWRIYWHGVRLAGKCFSRVKPLAREGTYRT